LGRRLIAFSWILAGLAACGGEADLRLAAAASLSEVLPPLLAEFEQERGVEVEVVFGGSGALVAQFRHGAPFDALLLAGMGPAAQAQVGAGALEVLEPDVLGNFVVLVAKPGWPPAQDPGRSTLRGQWRALAGKRVAIGGDGVPAGAYARAWMGRARLDADAVELVPMEHVRAVLAAVESGACAAGFVYFSDALPRPELPLLGADLVVGEPVAARFPLLLDSDAGPSARAQASALLEHLQLREGPFESGGFVPGGHEPRAEDVEEVLGGSSR